jgi:hypothetical protein
MLVRAAPIRNLSIVVFGLKRDALKGPPGFAARKRSPTKITPLSALPTTYLG